MFIFSSNSAKYSFEYKVSKPYRVDYHDKILLTPSILMISKDLPISGNFTLNSALKNISVELKDLLLSYSESESHVLNSAITNVTVSLRDLLMTYSPPAEETDVVNAEIGSLAGELKDVLITHTIEMDVTAASISGISGVLENV